MILIYVAGVAGDSVTYIFNIFITYSMEKRREVSSACQSYSHLNVIKKTKNMKEHVSLEIIYNFQDKPVFKFKNEII